MKPSFEKVTPLDVLSTPMELLDRTWLDTDVLMLLTPGLAHAVYVMWEEGQRNLLCFYVNLQEPITRTSIGFDTQDNWLDIVVNPDRSAWHWKDEDQLAEAVKLGFYTDEKARAIRVEGERVINLVRKNQSPFCDHWENWRAPSDWKIPELSLGWDRILSNSKKEFG